MAGAMSADGDSGLAVQDESDRVIGLFFAGSQSTTIMNCIQSVLEMLDVEVDP